MASNELQLGKIITGEAHRDAIHIAVAPLEAADQLYPGQHIALLPNDPTKAVWLDGGAQAVGIVDPFIDGPVYPGQRFYAFLFPGTVTGMRHEWRHPAFDAQPVVRYPISAESSKAWMEDFAKEAGLSYDVVMDNAKRHLEFGYIYVQQGSERARDAYFAAPPADFWHHYATITGTKLSGDEAEDTPFSCSC